MLLLYPSLYSQPHPLPQSLKALEGEQGGRKRKRLGARREKEDAPAEEEDKEDEVHQGAIGVDLLQSGKWRARVWHRGVRTSMGTFDSKIEAQQTFDSAAHHLSR